MQGVRGTSLPTARRISDALATRSDAIPITVARAVRTPFSSHASAHTIRRFACAGAQVRSASLHTVAGNASRDRLAVRYSVASGLFRMRSEKVRTLARYQRARTISRTWVHLKNCIPDPGKRIIYPFSRRRIRYPDEA